MMKSEFEAIAGYEVSWTDYHDVIEPMYMSTELTKQDFVKCLDPTRFALRTERQLIDEMQEEAEHLRATCLDFIDRESRSRLDALIDEYMNRFARGFACSLRYEYIRKETKEGYYPAMLLLESHYNGGYKVSGTVMLTCGG